MVQFFEVSYYVLPKVMLNVVWKEITRMLLPSCDKEPVKVIHENTIIFPQMKQEYAPWRQHSLEIIRNQNCNHELSPKGIKCIIFILKLFVSSAVHDTTIYSVDYAEMFQEMWNKCVWNLGILIFPIKAVLIRKGIFRMYRGEWGHLSAVYVLQKY